MKTVSKPLEATLVLLCALALAWVVAWYVRTAFVATPDFDGALNFNVSASLAEGRGYGSFYERYVLFPIETQTNGPLVVPAAASIALFGLTPIGLQWVNLLYLFALCGLMAGVLRAAGAGWGWAVLSAFVATQVPGMSQYAMFGYGEVAAACWAIAAGLVLASQLAAMSPRMLFLAGVLLGMSFLTKTVSLMWFPAVAGLYGLIVLRSAGWRAAFGCALWVGAGTLSALLAWELYRWASLGGEAYLRWWAEQYLEIRKQAGVKTHYADTEGGLTKLVRHGTALAGFLRVPGSLLVALGVAWSVVVACALWAVRHRPRVAYLLCIFSATAVLYHGWWLLITPTEMMWLRRIMLGLLAAQAALILAVALLWRGSPRSRVVGLLGLACLLLVLRPGQLLVDRPDRALSAQADIALAEAVAALPEDAIVFGSGWWQSPVVALLSGRRMHNEEAWSAQALVTAGRPAYLVVDRDALNLGRHMLERIAWRCDCEPVHLGSGGRIYRVRALFDSKAESKVEVLRIGAESDVFGPGFSGDDDGGFRWAEQEAQLTLETAVQSRTWVFAVTVPVARFARLAEGEALPVEFQLEGCGSERVLVPRGEQSIRLTLDCNEPVRTIRLRSADHLDASVVHPDTRKLSFLFKSLESYPQH